ncbi:plasmid partitioning protein RepB [Donghicola sp. C2-DW-16]|uniref:Plasmid partitioning protein RepB n=1 Tax=Donghicola mangrovi TaxID=2729614 RepID=A0ABX2PHK5_9RHOB|nr:plasmid partitioning protein RepB [Donghicola mangrovi]NVO28069.1 plasmid partitioning protein RepB [Donghicola mangrovi]
MARKNLLGNLTGPAGADAPAPAKPRRTTGAIGAVSQQIADLKTRALAEIPPELIDDAGLKDRLDDDPEGLAALVASIREYGQQVPVLLRQSPTDGNRYEIVYGRRRVAALRELGMPVRAMVRVLNDRDLIVAQGQENAARKDLTFIEKANFARQMVENGFDRKVICDALHIDKTVISRMLSVTDAVPYPIIMAIGAAPSVGRDRWLSLAARIKGRPLDQIVEMAEGKTSDDRFQSVFDGLAPEKLPKRSSSKELRAPDGTALGEVSRKGDKTVLTLKDQDGFDDWLIQNFDRIHQEFLKNSGD